MIAQVQNIQSAPLTPVSGQAAKPGAAEGFAALLRGSAVSSAVPTDPATAQKPAVQAQVEPEAAEPADSNSAIDPETPEGLMALLDQTIATLHEGAGQVTPKTVLAGFAEAVGEAPVESVGELKAVADLADSELEAALQTKIGSALRLASGVSQLSVASAGVPIVGRGPLAAAPLQEAPAGVDTGRIAAHDPAAPGTGAAPVPGPATPRGTVPSAETSPDVAISLPEGAEPRAETPSGAKLTTQQGATPNTAPTSVAGPAAPKDATQSATPTKVASLAASQVSDPAPGESSAAGLAAPQVSGQDAETISVASLAKPSVAERGTGPIPVAGSAGPQVTVQDGGKASIAGLQMPQAAKQEAELNSVTAFALPRGVEQDAAPRVAAGLHIGKPISLVSDAVFESVPQSPRTGGGGGDLTDQMPAFRQAGGEQGAAVKADVSAALKMADPRLIATEQLSGGAETTKTVQPGAPSGGTDAVLRDFAAAATPQTALPGEPVRLSPPAPVPAAPPSPTAPPEEQLRQHVTQQIRSLDVSDNKLRFSLSPYGMGDIEVEVVRSESGRMQIAMTAESASVLNMLRQDRDQLLEALQSRGITSDAADLDFQTFGERGRQDGRRADDMMQDHAGGPGEHDGPTQNDTGAAPETRMASGPGQLDILT